MLTLVVRKPYWTKRCPSRNQQSLKPSVVKKIGRFVRARLNQGSPAHIHAMRNFPFRERFYAAAPTRRLHVVGYRSGRCLRDNGVRIRFHGTGQQLKTGGGRMTDARTSAISMPRAFRSHDTQGLGIDQTFGGNCFSSCARVVTLRSGVRLDLAQHLQTSGTRRSLAVVIQFTMRCLMTGEEPRGKNAEDRAVHC